MNPLVFKTHEQRPERMLRSDRRMTGCQVGMRFDHASHRAIHLLAVSVNLLDTGPQHLVLGHIIPAHFIDAGLKQLLEIGIQRLFDQAGDPQLVDVQHRRMPVVENHRVAQVMIGRAEESFLTAQAGEQDLSQCPGIIEVIQDLLAAVVGQIGQG
jgi:hypothetical protein